MINRRRFLKNAVVVGLTLSGLEVLAVDDKIPVFKGFETDTFKIHDGRIKKNVDFWNEKFRNVEGYKPLDYETVKRMILVEAGGDPNNAWLHNPMQIGNGSDPGLGVLQRREENTQVLGDFSSIEDVKPAIRKNGRWDYSQTGMNSDLSLFAGLGWLIHKAAVYDLKTIEEGDVLEYVIQSGDNYSKISGKLGTTVHSLMKLNKTDPRQLKIGQVVKYKKAREEVYISGWRSWDDALNRYNGGGDKNYLNKIKALRKVN